MHKVMIKNEVYDKEIFQRNLSKLLIELDFSDLESVGTNTTFDQGVETGKQDMLAASMHVNWRTGEIGAVGNYNHLDPEVIYGEDMVQLELRVYIDYPGSNDGQANSDSRQGYQYQLLEPESPSGNSTIPFTVCMSDTAIYRLEQTLLRANDPDLR